MNGGFKAWQENDLEIETETQRMPKAA